MAAKFKLIMPCRVVVLNRTLSCLTISKEIRPYHIPKQSAAFRMGYKSSGLERENIIDLVSEASRRGT